MSTAIDPGAVSLIVADGQVRLAEPAASDPAAPRRNFDDATAAALFARDPAQRERYPFREDVLLAWEKKALDVDTQIQQKEISSHAP